MKRNITFIIAFVIGCFNAQTTQYNGKVGINTTNPTETLHVNGIAHSNLLYLRSPGEPQELPIYFMSSEVSQKNLNIYNPAAGKPSLVNLLDLTFNDVGNQGVTDYDTKIDADEFIVAVRSFSMSSETVYDNTELEVYTVHNASPSSNNSSNPYFQGSPDFVAFVDNNTWHVRAQYKDSRFTDGDANVQNSDRFSMKLQLLVYRKIITKRFDNFHTVDLNGTNGSTTPYVTPKPSGF